MNRIVLYFILLGLLSLSACNQEKTNSLSGDRKPSVLASIKPVQAIVMAIGGDKIDSHQLVPDYASPHHYSFKPSDGRKINNADLIFRIDKHFEVMLNPAFDNLSSQSKVIAFAENPAIKILPIIGSHSHEEVDEHDEHETHAEHDEEKDGHLNKQMKSDMHIFTSPENAIVMAQQIAESLSKVDPENKQYYDDNLLGFSQGIQQESNSLREKLSNVNQKPYIVFHYSWQYLGEYLGLKSPLVIDLQEGVTTGSKTLVATRKNIVENNIQCVFSDPSVRGARVKTLIEGLELKTARIDVLQANIALDQFTYINWLKEVGEEISSCLK